MTLTKEVVEFADALHIQDDNFKFPAVSPEEMMRWLMEKNNHKQTDMTDVASRTVINEILNGKRKLNRLHIERLCVKYDVDANWFYPERQKILREIII